VRGLALPTFDPDPKNFDEKLEKAVSDQGAAQKDADNQPGGKTFCALQLMLILTLASQIAPRLTVDGYFTVDYYTTFTLFFSLLTACMLRLWDPYTCRAVIYTKDLWLKGRDTFLYYDKENKKWEDKEVDLYEWFNLSAGQRGKMLLAFCRTLNSEQIDADLKVTEKNPKPEIRVVTFSDLTVEHHGYARHDDKQDDKSTPQGGSASKGQGSLTSSDMSPYSFDRTSAFIRSAGGTSGKVIKKSKVDGEVIFQFDVAMLDGDGDGKEEIGAHYHTGMEAEDEELGPLPEGKTLEVSVPMDKLIEKSPEWTYIRAAFGEQPLRRTVKA